MYILMPLNIRIYNTGVQKHLFHGFPVGHHTVTHRSLKSWVLMHFFGHRVFVFTLHQKPELKTIKLVRCS